MDDSIERSHPRTLVRLIVMSFFLFGCGGVGGGTAQIPDNATGIAALPFVTNPVSTTLPPGGTQQIQAEDSESSAVSVHWSVLEGPSGGSVDSEGHYTAPVEPGIYHLVAKSKIDPAETAQTTVLVTSPVPSSEETAPSIIAGNYPDADSAPRVAPKVSSSGGSSQFLRVLHLVIRRIRPEEMRTIILEASKAHFNTVILELADGVQLSSMQGMTLPDAWSIDDFLNVVHFAYDKGLEVIPGITLLTHQQRFFKDKRPDLMFNNRTYDPRKEETYQVVLPILDEVIALVHPRAIHIGHDEVLPTNVLPSGEEMLPADLYLHDIKRVYNHLKSNGVDTWMWGDMLIAPEEFPTMLTVGLNGNTSGYGVALRNLLPKDIVICDWHYFDKRPDFPSLETFQQDGFRVLGATWKQEDTIRNLSRYSAQHGAAGMIATVWFHTMLKEWNIVENIIKTSGEIFNNPN